MHETIYTQVSDYYTARLHQHGPCARGVDWNSPESQALRFEQLLKVCPSQTLCRVNDYGCGYGALVSALERRGGNWEYRGYDLSEAMIAQARNLYGHLPWCSFGTSEQHLQPADVTVASGIFNVKLGNDGQAWTQYVLDTLHKLQRLSRSGFAFNMLTSYSDADRMRADLYYGDPCFFFDYCKRNFSRQVALLHDYGLYEFTILVRGSQA
jgi:hypothetical protein